MSKNLSSAQVEAIDELINAFGCSHITSRQDCAESIFCQNNASHEEVGREMIKFATKNRLSEQTSSSDIQLDLLHRNSHHDGVAAQTPSSTSARNPLFSGDTSGSCHRADIAPNIGSARVVNGYPSVYKQPLHSRKGTTPSVPEDTLCRELCGALQGLEGSYFRKDSSGYMRVLDSCSLSESQRSVVESVLSVAHLHADIVRVPREHSNDLIVQQMITYCPNYGYKLHWIPPFFPVWVAEYILKTGKSWKSVDVKKCSDNLDKAREIIATQLSPKSLYVQGGTPFLSIILSVEFLLHSHVPERTHGLRSKLSQRDANNALMVAVTLSSSVRRFHFKINLDTLSSANDSPNTSSRLQFVHPLRPVYRPNGPIGEIFRDTEKRYESLFHFIWPVEMCLLMISDQINEVDQWFNRLRCWIDDAVDLDAVINAHTNYLRGMTSSFFMDADMEVF
ncbi:unnamed protein product [Angiostrongylus costaricensis]|uniref:Gamma-tubulin complex component n=1 Tax=Angiostrongylus costaricensis TaxID=334426 RepID=A0A0R3PS29_ANGCS|nr:unnamed protein product [Angiostrongylus costaricensis]